MTKKEVRNRIESLYKRARRAQRKCMFRGCDEISINSHLLQKKGIINQIAENNHVVELAIDNYKPDVFYFKRSGINDAFTFPGFCKTHDNDLFKEIETDNIDYSNYRTNLLLVNK
jgi:imidazole glycerol phosphate synthase subunit HisF